MAMPIAQYVVSVGLDGHIAYHGSVEETLANDKEMQKEVAESDIAEQKAEEAGVVDSAVVKEEELGKLMMAEEVSEGHIDWDARKWRRSIIVRSWDWIIGSKITLV